MQNLSICYLRKFPCAPSGVRFGFFVVVGGVLFSSVCSFNTRTVQYFISRAYQKGLLPVCMFWVLVWHLVTRSRGPLRPESGYCRWNTCCVRWDRAEIQECEPARLSSKSPAWAGGSWQQLSPELTPAPGSASSICLSPHHHQAALLSPAFPSPAPSAPVLFQLVITPLAPVCLCGISCCLLSVSKWPVLVTFPSSDSRETRSGPSPWAQEVGCWPACGFLVGLGHLSLFGWQGLVALGDWCGAVEGSEPGRCPGVERAGMRLVSYVFQNAKDDFKILMQPWSFEAKTNLLCRH